MKKLVLKKTKNGRGVYTLNSIKKSEKIVDFGGKFFTFDALPTPYDAVTDHYVQIGTDLYLGPSGKIDDYFNHSCNPNAGLKVKGQRAWLTAIKNISGGTEITWDYSTTMAEDEFIMDCR